MNNRPQTSQIKQLELRCEHCARPLCETRGAYSIAARCPYCERTTRFYDKALRERLDNERRRVL